MSTEARDVRGVTSSSWLPRTEDWWAVIIGLGLVVVAIAAWLMNNLTVSELASSSACRRIFIPGLASNRLSQQPWTSGE